MCQQLCCCWLLFMLLLVVVLVAVVVVVVVVHPSRLIYTLRTKCSSKYPIGFFSSSQIGYLIWYFEVPYVRVLPKIATMGVCGETYGFFREPQGFFDVPERFFKEIFLYQICDSMTTQWMHCNSLTWICQRGH